MNNKSLFDLFDGEWIDNIFTMNVRYLAYWSEQIELAALKAQSGIILTGCQYLSRLHRQQPLYNQLAQQHHVSLYAHLDTTLDTYSEAIHMIPIDANSELIKEWFVIVNTPTLKRGIIAREIHKSTGKRLFRGALVNRADYIAKVSDYLLAGLHRETA